MTKAAPRTRIRIDDLTLQMTPRTRAVDLRKRLCWETLFDGWPLLEEPYPGPNFTRECATMSETHWYQYESTTPGRIWRWDYPSFTNKELVWVFPGISEVQWDGGFPCITYLNGYIWVTMYRRSDFSDPDTRSVIAGGSVASLPITDATTITLHEYDWRASGPQEGAEIYGVIGVPKNNRLFGVGYGDELAGDRILSVLMEYFPDQPGVAERRAELSDTVTGYVFLEANVASDAAGRVWFVSWGVNADRGRICCYDTDTETFTQTAVGRETWTAPDSFIGTKWGLLYGEDNPPAFYLLDGSFKRRRVACLGGFPPAEYDAYPGADAWGGPFGVTPSFNEVVWFFDTGSGGQAGGFRRLVTTNLENIDLSDSFGQAPDLSEWGSVIAVGDSTGATLETGEPVRDLSRSDSLWCKWTAPADVTVEVDTDTSVSESWLRVFTGTSIQNLTLIVSGAQSTVDVPTDISNVATFEAKLGTTYYFQLLGRE